MNRLPQSFDNYAHRYDEAFTNSLIGKMQREIVWTHLSPLLKSPLRILEINCGTGEDACRLSGLNHFVTATDISLNMIEVAMLKAHNDQQEIEFRVCSFSELKSGFSEKKFDFIFSNFGGLNCIDQEEMQQLSSDFATLLNPDGKLFLVLMGRTCLWERLYFILKGQFQTAFRRSSHDGVDTTIINSTFKSFYFSPKEIERIFVRSFETVSCKPVGFWVPPSYLEPFFKSKQSLLNILYGLDKMTLEFSFLSNAADHFAIQMRKR